MSITSEPRKAFGESLNELDQFMRQMIDLTLRSFRGAVATIENLEGSHRDEVVKLDREMYQLKQKIVRQCVDLLALHAPVARDLRTITADLEIVTDLDRIGRYSKDIVEGLDSVPPDERGGLSKATGLRRMGELSLQMLDTVTNELLKGEAVPVDQIELADNEVDDLHEETYRQFIKQISEREISPALGAMMILVNRYLERVCDHAVNIAGDMEFVVTGIRAR